MDLRNGDCLELLKSITDPVPENISADWEVNLVFVKINPELEISL